jgi:hypothetical protein
MEQAMRIDIRQVESGVFELSIGETVLDVVYGSRDAAKRRARELQMSGVL